jgi:hypothetical protein
MVGVCWPGFHQVQLIYSRGQYYSTRTYAMLLLGLHFSFIRRHSVHPSELGLQCWRDALVRRYLPAECEPLQVYKFRFDRHMYKLAFFHLFLNTALLCLSLILHHRIGAPSIPIVLSSRISQLLSNLFPLLPFLPSLSSLCTFMWVWMYSRGSHIFLS